MNNRFHTEIEIGGPMTRVQLRTIAELAGQVGLSCHGENNYDPDWIEQNLMSQLQVDKPYLVVSDHEIDNGIETDLTDYLIEQKLPWNKRVSARHEYDGDLTWWRPRMKRPKQWCMTDSSARHVLVSLKLLKKWHKQRKDLAWVLKELEKISPPMDEAILTDYHR